MSRVLYAVMWSRIWTNKISLWAGLHTVMIMWLIRTKTDEFGRVELLPCACCFFYFDFIYFFCFYNYVTSYVISCLFVICF